MKNFKAGLAVVLSIMTAMLVVFSNADYFVGVSGNLGFGLEFFALTLATILAIPAWLVALTEWHKLHYGSYRAFKNWCKNKGTELVRP